MYKSKRIAVLAAMAALVSAWVSTAFSGSSIVGKIDFIDYAGRVIGIDGISYSISSDLVERLPSDKELAVELSRFRGGQVVDFVLDGEGRITRMSVREGVTAVPK
jgi:hypothetical protein